MIYDTFEGYVQKQKFRQQMMKDAISASGRTKTELACFVGVSPQTLTNWEREPDRISLEHLAKFAFVIGWNEYEIGVFVQGEEWHV